MGKLAITETRFVELSKTGTQLSVIDEAALTLSKELSNPDTNKGAIVTAEAPGTTPYGSYKVSWQYLSD